MNSLTNEELVYGQENKTYTTIIKSIESYGERSQRIFSINSALLGILFLVSTFIIDYLTDIDKYPDMIKIILGFMLVFGIIVLIFFFLSLWKFIPISKLQGYKGMDNYKFYKKYKDDTSFINSLTIKINELNRKNLEKIKKIRWHYKRSLLYTSIGLLFFFIFIILSLTVFLLLA